LQPEAVVSDEDDLDDDEDDPFFQKYKQERVKALAAFRAELYVIIILVLLNSSLHDLKMCAHVQAGLRFV